MSATVRHGTWPPLPGAEPFEYPGDPDLGALLVHGFTGSPGELRPVGEALAAADIGSAGVLLRGHGTHPNDMVGRTYAEWIEDVEQGLERLLERHRRAVVVGLSMGGTLALNVAARRADDPRLAGLVTISAPLFLSDWRLGLVGVISRIVKWQAWGRPDIKDRRVWDTHGAYRRIRTAAIPQLLGLMRETNQRLARVGQPILVVHAREDHIVPPGNLDRIRDGVASRVKSSMLLDNCYHVSTVDFEAERLNAEIVRFIRNL
ncbi:MAG: alpha/beta fold hydrolase [Chloroflexota bacterium]